MEVFFIPESQISLHRAMHSNLGIIYQTVCCRSVKAQHDQASDRSISVNSSAVPWKCCPLQISNDIVHFAVGYLVYEVFGEFLITHGENFLSWLLYAVRCCLFSETGRNSDSFLIME